MPLMTQGFLAAPESNVPSERMFSIVGQILTKRRSSLREDTVDTLVCSKRISRGYARGIGSGGGLARPALRT